MENKLNIYHQLIDLTKNIQNMNNEEIKEITETLEKINFEEIVTYLLSLQNYDDMDLVTIRKIIELTQFIYNNTDSDNIITDENYDKLYQLMLDKGLGEYVGSPNPKNMQGKKIRQHKYTLLRGTLSKIHYVTNVEKGEDNRRSLEDWIYSVENILGGTIYDPTVILQPKHDGLSVVHECDCDGNIIHSLTRGDTEKNLAIEITEMFKDKFNFHDYASNKPFGVKTEIVMTRDQFNAFCDEVMEYKSPRSAVSGILNRSTDLDPSLAEYLTVKPLRIQYEGDPNVIIVRDILDEVCDSIYSFKEMESTINAINENVREAGLCTDGIVIYLSNKNIQHELGRIGAINRYEVAYKFPAEEKKTELIDVDFSIGLGGNVTPVAKVKPIIMNGKTITSASLGSIDRFESLDLRKGDEVIIRYEIIPYLDKDSTCKKGKEKIYRPTHCRYCGHRLEEAPILKCVNDNCDSRIIGNIVNYINRMRIENISIGTVTTLFNEGLLKNIESLYDLSKHKEKIVNLPGFGIKSYTNIIKGIESKKDVYDYELLASLGIPNIGERIFKKVLIWMDIDTLLESCCEGSLVIKLLGVKGFGNKTCIAIQKGIQNKMSTIKFLMNTLNIKRFNANNKGTVCFSKIRNKEYEEELIKKGYEIIDSVNTNTNYLIVPSKDLLSSKIKKAMKYGTKILTLDEAYKNL